MKPIKCVFLLLGTAIHMPIPLAETHQHVHDVQQRQMAIEQQTKKNLKLPSFDQVHIIVRAPVSVGRRIIETTVNWTRIQNALRWLVQNNPLYEHIELVQLDGRDVPIIEDCTFESGKHLLTQTMQQLPESMDEYSVNSMVVQRPANKKSTQLFQYVNFIHVSIIFKKQY